MQGPAKHNFAGVPGIIRERLLAGIGAGEPYAALSWLESGLRVVGCLIKEWSANAAQDLAECVAMAAWYQLMDDTSHKPHIYMYDTLLGMCDN